MSKNFNQLKKANSHLAKVIEMTEKGDYCIDINQQNLAVIGFVSPPTRC